MAAPIATQSFGWADNMTGLPKRRVRSSLIRGTRDEPPTRTMAASPAEATPERRMTRSRMSTVSVTNGLISSSNSARVSRTRLSRPPSRIGTVVSVSLDSASLASVQSRRKRARPASASGSSGSRWSQSIPRPTRSNTASSKSTPPTLLQPVRRTQHLEVAGRCAPQDRGIERASAQVVHRDGLAPRHPPTGGEVDGGSLRLGAHHDRVIGVERGDLAHQLPPVRPPVGRAGHRHPIRRLALAGHHPIDGPAEQRFRQCVGRHR